MQLASKLLAAVCLLLMITLWAITIATDPTPGPVAAAAALTAIVALMIVVTSQT